MKTAMDYTDKAPDEMITEDFDKMWADLAESANKHNAEIEPKNRRLYRAIKRQLGYRFYKNMIELFAMCEVRLEYMGFMNQLELTRTPDGSYQETNEFGRKIKGYYVQQWAVGLEGDSWSGFICLELKKGLFIKAPFDC